MFFYNVNLSISRFFLDDRDGSEKPAKVRTNTSDITPDQSSYNQSFNENLPNVTCPSPPTSARSSINNKCVITEKFDEDSVSNLNETPAINLESDFIEAVIDEYKNKLV